MIGTGPAGIALWVAMGGHKGYQPIYHRGPRAPQRGPDPEPEKRLPTHTQGDAPGWFITVMAACVIVANCATVYWMYNP